MADVLQLTASLMWIALAIIVFVRLRQWNKKFGELHEELRKQIMEDGDG